MQTKRSSFYQPELIAADVRQKVSDLLARGERVDYLTFVPDGEPTLDINLGREIKLAKKLGIKVGVITNSSLIWREDVRRELGGADWVSVKIDAVSSEVWKKVNRPHGELKLEDILEGIKRFSQNFQGELVTETMLVKGLNDGEKELMKIAEFVAGLKSNWSYLSVPIRPPAEKWVRPPDEAAVARAYQIFVDRGLKTECLIGYEGSSFGFSGQVEDDLLSTTAVHPMREESVRELLARAGVDWSVVEKLIAEKKLVEVEYKGKKFYLRKF
jgi:wyosine [tRNA(Phe)-imidazoG37] synthetase (radical SAM superfamily)